MSSRSSSGRSRPQKHTNSLEALCRMDKVLSEIGSVQLMIRAWLYRER